jgi:hypothetical protein
MADELQYPAQDKQAEAPVKQARQKEGEGGDNQGKGNCGYAQFVAKLIDRVLMTLRIFMNPLIPASAKECVHKDILK